MSYKDEQLISFEHVLEKSECENFEKFLIEILSGWINNRVNFFRRNHDATWRIINFLGRVSLRIDHLF